MTIKGKTYRKTGFWYVLVGDKIYTIPTNCHRGFGKGLTFYNWGATGVEDVHPSWLEDFEGAPVEEFNLD